MRLKWILSLLTLGVLCTQTQALGNTPNNALGQKSTSSSDVINQNQNSVTNNDTIQSSTGVVQQSATYNVGQASTYDFRGISGTRIYCPKPSLLVSGGSNFGAHGSSSNQVSAAFVLPLGGKLNKNCTKVSNQIVKEQEDYILFQSFNHQYEMASRCTALLKSGATINEVVFPELAQMCSGVSVVSHLDEDETSSPSELNSKLTIPVPTLAKGSTN